jgi:hypothetical protein
MKGGVYVERNVQTGSGGLACHAIRPPDSNYALSGSEIKG